MCAKQDRKACHYCWCELWSVEKVRIQLGCLLEQIQRLIRHGFMLVQGMLETVLDVVAQDFLCPINIPVEGRLE